jgi:CBS domain-containing protein
MTAVSEIMTRDVRAMSPNDSLVQAAKAMEELNVGVVPVCEGETLIGVVTDRDITVRGVAQGRAFADTRLSDIMSRDLHWCSENQDIEEVLRDMSQYQVRRLPVVDRDKHLVGMVTIGDIAAKTHRPDVGDTLGDISEPAAPARSGTSAASGKAGGGSKSGSAGGMAY